MSNKFQREPHPLVAFEQASVMGRIHLQGQGLRWRAWRVEQLRGLRQHPERIELDADSRTGLALALDQAVLLLAVARPRTPDEFALKQALLADCAPACPDHAALGTMVERALEIDRSLGQAPARISDASPLH